MTRNIYVASSWRNDLQPAVVEALRSAGHEVYDFKNPPGGTGFAWSQVRPEYDGPAAAREIRSKGADWEPVDEYLAMVSHPRAAKGFKSDFDAMREADTFVMVLPCGKSAHLELGWAAGAHKTTVVLLEDPVEPELMYLMCSKLATSIDEVVTYLTRHTWDTVPIGWDVPGSGVVIDKSKHVVGPSGQYWHITFERTEPGFAAGEKWTAGRLGPARVPTALTPHGLMYS